MLELEREVVKAQRTSQPYVLAFIDVDALKARNDELGHAAGDDLLRTVSRLTRSHVREYDLLVRYGGDEFVCGLMGLDLVEATTRFEQVNTDLAAERQASVSVGLALLAPDEGLRGAAAPRRCRDVRRPRPPARELSEPLVSGRRATGRSCPCR